MSSEQLLTEDLRLVEEVGLECVGERERERENKKKLEMQIIWEVTVD